MEPLLLQGENLGQKHRHYNKLLKDIISTNTTQETQKICYSEPDIDNLLKIDIACYKRDVDYIVDVLKCEDMLYISRALKRSVWLITDKQYAHIINPKFLHNELLPQMTSKAGHKLILNVRLNLKDEQRVELFYKYYEEKKEFKTALKWLPHCSISHIEDVVEKRVEELPEAIIKRLCEKSIRVLEIYARKNDDYQIRVLLSKTTFLLNNNAEKFVAIVNSQERYAIPKFNKKSTKIIMKISPDIILDNFAKFASKIYIPAFVKFLKREDIKGFLIKHFENNNLKSWFNIRNLKHFLFRMPSECRFDFVKQMCIDKSQDNSEGISYSAEEDCQYIVLQCASTSMPQSNTNIYTWYKFAPFDIAFTDLKKLIRAESNPSERNEIFAVLVFCAKQSLQNLYLVLQYYRQKHINEPFRFKSHFVNVILSQINLHRIDDKIWTILNDIFSSMEVYGESENNVQSCLKHIIVYKVLHKEKVPDIVEKKFEFDTLKSFQSKLNDEEKDKVFNYLYQFMSTKIQNITVNSKSDLQALINDIINVLNLLSDWKKCILHYSIILEKIREVIKIKENNSWNNDLSGIYNVKKSWRRHMFKESLSLHPTPETWLNALKHGPKLHELCQENIYFNDTATFIRLLSKLRTYWPEIAKAFEDTYQNTLNDKTKHKMSIRGLCILLPNKKLSDVLYKYKPTDTKINWSETENLTLNIQKYLAKYMHLARPHPPVQVMLLYAKGDYLQFVLPSVHSIFFNISSDRSTELIPALVDAPVSLQKHVLRTAFAKLKMDELLPICLNTWKSTKNFSIRATIFKIVFDLMCKEQYENKIKEIWNILSTFIENLTPDENKLIYVTLGQAKKVPLPVKNPYCIKSYRFLKSLPSKAKCHKLVDSVIFSLVDIMESIDVEFAVEVIFDSFDEKIMRAYYSNYSNVISAGLLSSKSELDQTRRYEMIFVPLLKKYLVLRDTEEKQFYLKYNFKNFLQQLHNDFVDITINKNMITPIKLFSDICNDLEKNFCTEDNYVLIMTWKLAVKYIQVIDKYRIMVADISDEEQSDNKSDNRKENIICLKAAPDFGKFCVEQLQEEIQKYFPSIYRLFSKALQNIFDELRFTVKGILYTLQAVLEHADIVEGHLLVLKLLPNYHNDNTEKEIKSKICEILRSHPSAEVRMPYQQMLREKERYEE